MLTGDERVTVILGEFGSGKTEVALNLALYLSDTGKKGKICLVDLDLVNPYFRSRELRQLLRERGIRVIVPEEEKMYADLPILLPEVRSAIIGSLAYCILDVGGSDIGARVLGSLHDALGETEKRVLAVVNARRPLTSTVESAVELLHSIEGSCRCKLTGLVSNTHLMENTTLDVVLEGVELAKGVAKEFGVRLEFATAPAELAEEVRSKTGLDVLPMQRLMKFPWQMMNRGPNLEGKDLFHL